MSWPHRKLEAILHQEGRILAAAYPSLALSIRSSGYALTPGLQLTLDTALVEGSLPVPKTGIGYEVTIILSRQHPKHMPLLVCRDPAIPAELDRHINGNGTACLCSRAESAKFYPPGAGLIHFIDQLVVPFLVGQFFYTAHGRWPGPEREHGWPGILQAYESLLGTRDVKVVTRFLQHRLLKKRPKGHGVCPCGSGRKLRDCHAEKMWALWNSVSQDNAAHDLADLQDPLGVLPGLGRRIDITERFGLRQR